MIASCHHLNYNRVQQRMRANALAKAEALATSSGKPKSSITDAQIDALMSADDIDKYVEVTGWQGRPPRWKDLLIFWIFWSPLKVHDFFYFHIRWIVSQYILHILPFISNRSSQWNGMVVS